MRYSKFLPISLTNILFAKVTDAKRDVILEGGLITDLLGDTSSPLDTSLLCFLIEIVLEKEKLAYQQHN